MRFNTANAARFNNIAMHNRKYKTIEVKHNGANRRTANNSA